MSDVQGLDAGKAVFLIEATEILEQLEESLLELEESPDNIELVGSVFRALHTIKGSGAMFGFDRVSSFTHEVETVFDEVRSGNMQVSRELIDLTLASRDIIRGMLDADQGEGGVSDEEAQTGGCRTAKTFFCTPLLYRNIPITQEAVHARKPIRRASLTTWRIRFKPPEDVFATGTNPIFLLEDLRELGDCDIVSMTDDIPRLADLDPERFYFGWDILLTTDKGREAIEDVFIFIGEDSDLKIEAVEHHDLSTMMKIPRKNCCVWVIFLSCAVSLTGSSWPMRWAVRSVSVRSLLKKVSSRKQRLTRRFANRSI